jgi:serine/threonine protein kinase
MSDHTRQPISSEPTASITPDAAPLPTLDAEVVGEISEAGAWPTIPDYEILGQLAPGGMGVVYQARQVGLNRLVALKMIREGIHAGPLEWARFKNEAEAVASLSHPHIIQIHDFGEWNGMPYLTMEFAGGGSLAQQLRQGAFAPLRAAEMVETLARAMHFVHERGIIHRDLKPANVLLTEQGIPKLADFGLAKRLDDDQQLTRTKAVLGTASYMAPEQAAGDKNALGPATDIYALGAILYELLSGQPPFRAATREMTIHQVLSQDPVPLTQLRADVPAELEAVCLKCLEKEPRQRFASARELAEDLRSYQKGEPLSIQPAGPFEWHARAARRAGYELLDLLGVCGLGIVYQARQISLNRVAVLEMIASAMRLDDSQIEHLRMEAEVVAQLHHPNIVEVYDFGALNDEPFIAREYVAGTTLADRLTNPLQPPEQNTGLIETLAWAVHHAHLHDVVHGSLRPSKVLLGSNGVCKITGFGLAPVLRTARAYSTFSSYMAPEQADGLENAISPAVDIYALGAILYELLTGRPPVLADSIAETLEQLRRRQPEPPRHIRPEIARELEAICLKCLQKNPSSRYPSAAALAEDLRRFRSGEVLFIDDLDDWQQQQRWARRAGYEILDLLGATPDWFTYKARHVSLDRIVVLKRVAAKYRFVPPAKERFRWEARRLARLRHPNFVQLLDQGEQNDLSFFAREFVEGRSLAEIAAAPMLPGFDVDGDEDSPLKRAGRWTEKLARAVHAAHTDGIVLGGLNAGRIYVTLNGTLKITSLRRERAPIASTDQSSWETVRPGIIAYLAPEQLEAKRRTLAPAADVYSLGGILYTLLTGQLPFLGQTVAKTLEQIRTQQPLTPRHYNCDVSPRMESICLLCLDKNPDNRPASALALADELHDILN